MSIIIYDNNGFIFDIKTGAYKVPNGGVQYIEVEIPQGKHPVSVDMSGTEPAVVYADLPKSETALLKEQVDMLTLALAEMMGV